ncbi:MAG TPA: MFS transporter [Polyangia bacterium]|jgi:EmrB/QacA subfamily drug resistance transporter|nr:MFS transporter [Polyangia bacterium]
MAASKTDAQSQPLNPPAPSTRIVPWLVAVAFFMEALDSTILNTAVPTLAAALHVQPLSMKSVLSSYTLSLAVFIPLSGWVADRFGTRRVFGAAIAIFMLGSLLCGLATDIHALVLCRILQGGGGALMVPVGRLTMVRVFPKSQLVRAMAFVAIPALIGPMLGPVAGGALVRFFSWRLIFFLNLPFGLVGLGLVVRFMPDFRGARTFPLDIVGLVLFSAGVALLSYVLEVFGEHALSAYEILGLLSLSMLLLFGYVWHARSEAHPLLRLDLLRIRTLRVAVGGSFLTRLGVGGMPFLLPLLYQTGLGYSPLQSGLLILPQPLAAMSLRLLMPHILRRVGYRRVLLLNTIALGILIGLFAIVGLRTPVWIIVLQAFAFGFFSSFQYTSMNTLGYADVADAETSLASTIASAAQQLSMSFGVASASLAAALFIPHGAQTAPLQIIHGIHMAFLALGAFTLLSSITFSQLKSDDGDNVSLHKVAVPAE